jgi:hypothetical protein
MAPGCAGGHRIGRCSRLLPVRRLALWRAQNGEAPQKAVVLTSRSFETRRKAVAEPPWFLARSCAAWPSRRPESAPSARRRRMLPSRCQCPGSPKINRRLKTPRGRSDAIISTSLPAGSGRSALTVKTFRSTSRSIDSAFTLGRSKATTNSWPSCHASMGIAAGRVAVPRTCWASLSSSRNGSLPIPIARQ